MNAQQQKNGFPEMQSFEMPKGAGIQQIEIKPGMKLSLVNFLPDDPQKYTFETRDAPLEFSFHLSGQADYSIHHQKGKNDFKGKSGLNIASCFPNSHSTMEIKGNAPIRMLAIHMEPSFLANYLTGQGQCQLPEFESLVQTGKFPYYFKPGRMSASMSVVAAQLFDCPYGGIAGQWFYESKTLELLVLQFARISDLFQQAQDRMAVSGQDAERIRMAQGLLCRDLENPPSLFQLARAVGMTHTKLNKGFKHFYGTTVFGYLRRHRLEESRLLLDAGQMNVSETAYASGFSSPSHFARAFFAHFGVQPSVYLKEVLQRRMISVG